MAEKPDAADAQLILQLYELRRETEIRKARAWWTGEFFPRNADDFLHTLWDVRSPHSSWLRQVIGYWSMAASFVRVGVLNEELFLQPSVSGEMFIIYAKVHPFVDDLRKKMDDSQLFLNIENVINNTQWGRERLQFTLKRVEMIRQRMAEQKAGPPAIPKPVQSPAS